MTPDLGAGAGLSPVMAAGLAAAGAVALLVGGRPVVAPVSGIRARLSLLVAIGAVVAATPARWWPVLAIAVGAGLGGVVLWRARRRRRWSSMRTCRSLIHR